LTWISGKNIPLWVEIRLSADADGTFSRDDVAYNQEADVYVCPIGKVLSSTGTLVNDGQRCSIMPANMTMRTLFYAMRPT
jgi:hypothetical protein